jgi:Ni/Fe-hydrogenase subunit HybB-like protein
MKRVRSIFWRVIAIAILAAGAYAAYFRLTKGLGASTNLSDQYPWGIWIGFDILCGVGLAAGGFTLTTAVYILHLERFRPIVRPAVLTSFLGYIMVVFGLMFDLGRPWNIWRATVYWNPHSVMFEVAWCVMLYSTVLALEFSPVLLEGMKWFRAAKAVKSAVVPLVGLGCLLSTLHQSSLGTLYLILPTKVHALWYSPLLPVLFWISAVGIGMAMIIFESGLSARAFGHALEFDLLQQISRAMAAFLGFFLFVRFLDLGWRGSLGSAFVFSGKGSFEANMFWLEIALIAIPVVLVLLPRVRNNPQALFACSALAVGGFMVNRLNVSSTSLEAATGVRYIPSWMELAITMMAMTVGIILFGLAARYLPVFQHGHTEPHSQGDTAQSDVCVVSAQS